MPLEFEAASNNCDVAAQVLDAGIEAYVAARNLATEITYNCVENHPTASAWQVFLYIYVAVLLFTFAGWLVFYRRGASVDTFLKWGILSFVFPPLGPIVASFNYGDSRENIGTNGASNAWDEKDQISADY